MTDPRPLDGAVALVTGATRGAGRGTAVELGAAGATVYATGRTTRTARSPMNRAETIEDTADLVTAAGGTGIAVRVDHTQPDEVKALVERIASEQDGRLDLLVNDIWGGDPLIEDKRFWEHPLAEGLLAIHNSIDTHLITSALAAPMILARGQGLIIDMTDGTGREGYRGNLYYDIAKQTLIRLAEGQAEELRPHGVTALALTPGFLRSEAMLDYFGVTAETWRDGIAKDRHFAASETPHFVGRAVVALASDPDVARFAGQALSSWELAREYEFDDVDGTRPDWGAHYAEHVAGDGG